MSSAEWRFVLAALATWRLTHLVTAEDGPADSIVRIREWLGQSILGRAMDCFYCSSLWLAAPLALFVSREPVTWFVAWLASSGAACLLDRATDREGRQPPVMRQTGAGDVDELLWRAPGGAANDVPAAPRAGANGDGGGPKRDAAGLSR